MKKDPPRRGGWSGGPVPKPNYRFVWWCLAIGLTAVAVAIVVILQA